FLRRPRRWLEAIEAQRITHCGAPGSAYAACIQALGGRPFEGDLTSLVSLTCGAEPIRPEMVDDLLAAFGQAGLRPGVFMPCYGLAESVLGVTIGGQRPQPLIVEADAEALQAHRFVAADAASPRTGRRLVGCGRPLPGVALEIVDPVTGRRASPGAVGEIWVSSPSVGGGYWMQAEATQAVFGGRLDGAEGSAWLRTGDLGFVHESELFVTGRLKDLIIVHGENHYPQDIEWTAERAHADLRPNHGIAFSIDTPEGEGIVLALELARRTTEPDPEAIFLDVRRALAVGHALPLHTLLLCRAGTLPRTSSGKLQRAPCRALYLSGKLATVAQFRGDARTLQPDDEPGAQRAQERAAQVMPHDEVEQEVWRIWREVLGTPSFGVNESFFELGGSSLRMTQVLSRINARFHVELPLADVFEHASVAALAEQIRMRLDSVRSGAVAAVPPPGIERVERGEPLPASLSQRRMWVIQHFDPASTAYNVPIAIRVRGAFDRAVCQQALDLMIERHEGLRTCFVMRDEPMQWIEPRLSVPIEWIDLSHLPEAQRNAHARELLAHRLSQPFDLSMAPLHRPTLLRLGEREHVLFWLIHHAIVDNWSAALLMREALVAYGELLDGRSPPSTPPEVEYADYAAWQRRPESVEARKPHLAYWTDNLSGLPDLDLPTEFPRPAKASFKGARVSADLPARLREAMRQFETREAVTPFVVYLAAFVLMLSRQARSEDVAVGTPIANRHRFASELLLGTLVNTLVMRTDLSGDPSFTQLVHRVRKNALEAHAHQDAPFDELIDALGHDRTAQPQGPVRVLFNEI
ncbi:MAG: AMP-binding protein, partial [Gammaproteobacteria bacterium]|nr:AMP-binding protein [Gammaproteobacteria bacterium]